MWKVLGDIYDDKKCFGIYDTKEDAEKKIESLKEKGIYCHLYIIEEDVPEYAINKKRNIRYWDNIDGKIEKMVREIADFSVTQIPLEEATDIVADVRELVIEQLREIGGEFPYINENY